MSRPSALLLAVVGFAVGLAPAAAVDPAAGDALGYAGGAVAAPAEEVARFLRGLFAHDLLRDSTLARMTEIRDGESRMGLGIFGMPYRDQLGYGHTGGIDGFRSQAAYFPADSLAVVFLSNAVTGTTPNDVLLAVLHAYHGHEVEIPSFGAPAADLDPAYLESLAGTYAAADFPLDIVLLVEGGQLFGQATGQGPFPLTAHADSTFAFEAAGIEMAFPEAGVMDFAQGPVRVRFQRK